MILIELLILGFSISNITPVEMKDNDVYIYLEAEQFDNVGGWMIDSQFRQLMGSTYLLAAGIGEPVADANTKVNITRDGTYQLWVRCKDWHETSPGVFQVLINDLPSSTTFGTQKKGWSWIAGGTFELPKGSIKVGIHDLTGYYGRCDAIFLTTDKDFRPPDDISAITELRKAILGDPKPEELTFDFVVIGGGYGGICSAIQAARLGVKTALIQDRPCLGGNASKEIDVGPGGASPHSSAFRETGICEEIAESRAQKGVENWSDAIDMVVKDVPNLSIFLNTQGVQAIMENKHHISAISAENVVTGKKYIFHAPVFADCTGDGGIAFSAGAEFHHGQESQNEFNESYAPEEPNSNTMGTSIIHHSVKMDTPQPFTPPSFAVEFTQEYFTERKQNLVNGDWWIEYGGLLDTIKDAEEIRDELIRVIFGAFDWAKNHDPETRDKVQNYKLSWLPPVGGKRESRRFFGDYILTQNDVENATLFPDRVAFGGWPIDLHPSPGIYGKDIPPAIFHSLKQVYSIPYRILYTKDVDNLFLAGRHVSVTHVALGTTRLMQTIGVMGQAVGVAAYLCKEYDTLPRGVNPDHIKELQQYLLKWDAYIPEIINEDSGDRCKDAKAAASSIAPKSSVQVIAKEPKMDRDAPCTSARGQTFILDKGDQHKLSLYLQATGQKLADARLHIDEDDNRKSLTVLTAQVTPGDFYWVDFALPMSIEVEKPYFVWLEVNPNLCWKIYYGDHGERVYGQPDAWIKMTGRYALRPFNIPSNLGDVSPSMAIDGLKWPLKRQVHQWRSDPDQGLPQWLQIDFGKQVKLNTIYLVFDTNISGRFHDAESIMEVTAENYRLMYNDGGTWKVVFSEDGNWSRFRRHQFAPINTDKICLEISKAKNGNQARLYEIRAYYED